MLEANWKRELLIEQQKVVKDCLCPNCGGDSIKRRCRKNNRYFRKS